MRGAIEQYLWMHPKDPLKKWLPGLRTLHAPITVQRFFPEDMPLVAPRILQLLNEHLPEATWQGLSAYSVHDILQIPGMNEAHTSELLYALIELALRPVSTQQTLPRPVKVELQPKPQTTAPAPPVTPEAVQEASAPVNLTAELTEILSIFPQSEQDILYARVFSKPDRATLVELGDSLGVTRERVRQIQARATRNLNAEILKRPQVTQIAKLLSEQLGVAFPVKHPRAIAVFQDVLGPEDSIQNQALMMYLAGPYVMRNGVLWKSDNNLQLPAAQQVDRIITDTGALEEDLIQHLIHHGVREEFAPQILESFQFHIVLGRYFLRRPATEDLAYFALTEIGKPATVEEIAELGSFTDRNLRGIRSRLLEDKRFIRVNKDELALAEWGLTEFSSITDAIAREIEEAGVPVPITYLVETLPKAFGVSPTSVRAYLEAPLFLIEDGQVRFRKPDEPFEAGGDMYRRAGTFQLGNLFTLHVPVTPETMRGSGVSVPTNVVQALGLTPGVSINFTATDRVLPANWSSAALNGNIGSVRGFALAHEATPGDTLRLTFNTQDLTVITALIQPHYEDALRGLSEYTGFAFKLVEEVISQLPEALGFPAEGVVHALRGRGDYLAADLYEELIRSS